MKTRHNTVMGFKRNAPPKYMYLSALPQSAVMLGVYQTLGGRTLQENVDHWKRDLEVIALAHFLFSLSLLPVPPTVKCSP